MSARPPAEPSRYTRSAHGVCAIALFCSLRPCDPVELPENPGQQGWGARVRAVGGVVRRRFLTRRYSLESSLKPDTKHSKAPVSHNTTHSTECLPLAGGSITSLGGARAAPDQVECPYSHFRPTYGGSPFRLFLPVSSETGLECLKCLRVPRKWISNLLTRVSRQTCWVCTGKNGCSRVATRGSDTPTRVASFGTLRYLKVLKTAFKCIPRRQGVRVGDRVGATGV